MSGHSKWSKIKRKKGASDARRSKIFSKIIKEIVIAVRVGGSGDPEMNPRLRMAIANAKGVNMPKDNIDRNIKKASEAGGESYMEVIHEGYGANGVALVVECTTDNTQRTVANIRHTFGKYGGNMANKGSVEFMFDQKGIFVVPQNDLNVDDFMLELIDGGAEDVEIQDGYFTITTAKEDFGNMQKFLEKAEITPENASLQYIPKTMKEVDLDGARKAIRLVEALEDDDDVQAVYHNLEMTDNIMAALEAD